uniref:Uncharacterized protein n=1 Tax=Mycobacterium kansasii TaxID=1768 RepID=A0A653ETZ2_MYCKA|nr:hypothetical protein BIN_B_02588 [Mycobacterium kansasii]
MTASTVKPTSATPTNTAIAIIVFNGRPIIEMMMARLLSVNVAAARASMSGRSRWIAAASWVAV